VSDAGAAGLPGSSSDAHAPPLGARGVLLRYLARFDDGELLRWSFRGLLIGAIGVLSLDLWDLAGEQMLADRQETPGVTERVLPPAVELDAPASPVDPRPYITAEPEVLGQTMAFSLEAGGVMRAIGTIEAGTAERFASEMEKRGEYIKVLALNSPGGVVEEAMAMARLVREHKLATRVDDGALCASSCPLLFAGGVERFAGAKAALGVHQVYAQDDPAIRREQVMADTQATTAKIARHLQDMGVDPALWLHALDTPPRSLYYFSQEELGSYRLVSERAS